MPDQNKSLPLVRLQEHLLEEDSIFEIKHTSNSLEDWVVGKYRGEDVNNQKVRGIANHNLSCMIVIVFYPDAYAYSLGNSIRNN